MAKTIVHENESIDDALRRFKRSVSRSGTLQEYRKREFYEKPSVRRKLKSEAARKRRHYNILKAHPGMGEFFYTFILVMRIVCYNTIGFLIERRMHIEFVR